MKKLLCIVIVAVICSLCGCSSLTETPDFSDTEPVGPVFEYSWEPDGCREYSNEFVKASPTPRGVMLLKNGFEVYSPNTGTLTPVCGDPVCSHEAFGECPFSDYLRWLTTPVTDGEYLYYVHRNIVFKEHEVAVDRYSLVRTDLYGMGLKELYGTKNAIDYIILSDGFIYFYEYADEEGAILRRCDLASGECTSPKINSDRGLICSAYIPVGGVVYYVYDGRLFKCDPGFTSSQLLADDYFFYDLYTDGRDIYSKSANGIMKTDVGTGKTVQVYASPQDHSMFGVRVSDSGLTFMLREDGERPISGSMSYGELVSSPSRRVLYQYLFASGTVGKYDLGDFVINNYVVYKGRLWAQTYEKSVGGSGASSGEWYTGELASFEPRQITGL